jgi:tRNA-intron endonuclease
MDIETPIVILVNDKTVIYGKDAENLWKMGFYGEIREEVLTLLPVETLYLVENGKIRVCLSKDRFLSFNELLHYFLKYDPEVWIKYIIYSDLRKKGYIVKSGFGGISFRVYEKGAEVGKSPANIIVYGVIEGKPIGLNELKEIVSTAKSLKKEMVLAIVNGQCEVAYYKVSEVFT